MATDTERVLRDCLSQRATRWNKPPGRRATSPCSSSSSSLACRSRRRIRRCARTSASRLTGSKPRARQHAVLALAAVSCGCGRGRGPWRWRCTKRQLFQHVLGGFHQLGALPEQRMAAARLRRMDRARVSQTPPCPAPRPGRAVISEPDFSAASTTTVPWLSPAMMRLRLGKFWPSGGVPSGYSLTIKPLLRDAMGKLQVLARVDTVQSGAHHGDGGQLAGQAPPRVRLHAPPRPRPVPVRTPP